MVIPTDDEWDRAARGTEGMMTVDMWEWCRTHSRQGVRMEELPSDLGRHPPGDRSWVSTCRAETCPLLRGSCLRESSCPIR